MPSYLLVLTLPQSAVVRTRAKAFSLPKGRYLYVGSYHSLHRPLRHLRRRKALHWHIDHLLQKAEVEALYFSPLSEEEVALFLQPLLPVVEGFGSSDSPAKGHLFLLSTLP